MPPKACGQPLNTRSTARGWGAWGSTASFLHQNTRGTLGQTTNLNTYGRQYGQRYLAWWYEKKQLHECTTEAQQQAGPYNPRDAPTPVRRWQTSISYATKKANRKKRHYYLYVAATGITTPHFLPFLVGLPSVRLAISHHGALLTVHGWCCVADTGQTALLDRRWPLLCTLAIRDEGAK